MADKAISELISAEQITAIDMFVLEQDGTAKKLTGQVLLNWLTAAADGHGGIQSWEPLKTVGLVKTYRVTLADQTYIDIDVVDGRGVKSVTPTATNGLVVTYTITYNDDTIDTFTVTNGAKGDKGDNANIWVKYASQQPTESSHSFGDIPDAWVGISSGHLADAPTDWQEYRWYQWKGEKGDTGEPAKRLSVVYAYQVGDTVNITPSGVWQSTIPNVPQGKYLWIRKTTTWNTGDPDVDYTVSRMGIDGLGRVVSVAGVSPDERGNVDLTAADVRAMPITGGDMEGGINMNGQTLSGLNAPTNDDHAANMGYVNATKKEAKDYAEEQVRKAAPFNYLDNSDFRNPVNQRGETSYSNDGIYTIDRWKKRSTGLLTVVANEGIEITSVSTFGGIIQPIENGTTRLAGKTVTLAAYVLESPGAFEMMLGNTVDNATVGTTYGKKAFTEAGICVSSVTLPETFTAGDYLNFFIGEGDGGAAAGSKLKIAWCALYEGEYTAENLPKYQPKGYSAEFIECSRYFINYGEAYSLAGYTSSNGTTAFFNFPTPVEMRTMPTLGHNGGDDYFAVRGGGVHKPVEFSSCTMLGRNPNNIAISCPIELTAKIACTLYFDHGDMFLSADL